MPEDKRDVSVDFVLFHVKIKYYFFTCQECIAQVRTCGLWMLGNKWKSVVELK